MTNSRHSPFTSNQTRKENCFDRYRNFYNVLEPKGPRLLYGRASIRGLVDEANCDEIVSFRKKRTSSPFPEGGRLACPRTDIAFTVWLASVAKVGALGGACEYRVHCSPCPGAPPRCSSRLESVFSGPPRRWIYEFYGHPDRRGTNCRLNGAEAEIESGSSRKTGGSSPNNRCNFPSCRSKSQVSSKFLTFHRRKLSSQRLANYDSLRIV